MNVPEQNSGLFRVYKASAGSGKTYTLVKEYLTLALSSDNPYYFRHILAITFTNKAAGEMKDRVLAHLKSLSALESEDAYDSCLMGDYIAATGVDQHTIRIRAGKVLKAVLHRYSDLSISTIDKFIHRILRNFSRDLQLQLDFELSTDEDALLQEAVDELLNEAGNDELLTRILLEFTLHKTDQESNWDISHELFTFCRILFREDSLEPVHELRKLESDVFLDLRKKCSERMAAIRSKVAKLAGEALKILEENNLDAGNFAYKMSGPVALFYKFRHGQIHEWIPGQRSRDVVEKDNWYSKSESPEVKATIENVKQDLNRLNKFILDIYDEELGIYKLYQELSSSLFSLALLQEVDNRMERMKEERNVLLISDFNRKISSIVLTEHAPFIYERIGEKYNHIFIDEFQDTSVLQWQNFIPLFENSLSQGNACMLVGDPKQSIYRFRNGEMEQLVKLPEIYQHRNNEILLEKQELFRYYFNPVVLDTNYRSLQTIVEFNNYFFKLFFEYFDEELRSVYEDISQRSLPDKTGGYAEIHFINSDEEEKGSVQVNRTISSVQECLDDNFEYRDITVLVRKNTEGSEIASALAEAGIPVISQDSLLVGTSDLVQVISSCMIWLSDLNQEIFKATFIQSYLRAFAPEEDLAGVIFRHRRGKFTDVNSFLKEFGINLYPAVLFREPLYVMAEKICGMFLIPKSDPYVNAFLDLLFQNNSVTDLSEFRTWWEEKGCSMPVKVPEGTNAVRVMTIHKSKGLQFPVVIVPFADWEMKPQRKELWAATGDLLAPLKYVLVNASETVFKSLNQESLFAEEKNKTLLDNINALYVAFTRPEERLYIFSRSTSGENNTCHWIKRCSEGILQEADNEGVFFSGKKGQKRGTVRKHDISVFDLKTEFPSDWQEKVRISFEWKKAWGDGESYSSAEYGNVLHEVLALINTKDDIEKAGSEIFTGSTYSEKLKEDVLNEIKKLSGHPFFCEVFSGAQQVKTECEIIDETGNSYRPDRIIFDGKKATVVDFKTGKMKESHYDQIRHYGSLLKDLGYTSVDKYLFYTSDNNLVKVS